LGASGLVRCGSDEPWSRVVIEKPFGHDRASSDALAAGLAGVFTEPQTYRIDHYLGKEVIQNLMVLRFANLVFEPVWRREHIERVWIDWREDLSLEGRAGYFDQYGIIRDVMQNHLLQILALVAMENPGGLSPRAVRDAKVNVLHSIPPLTVDDVVIGQYHRSRWHGRDWPAYREEEGVPDGSRTPTFAAAVLRVNTPRWQGVPFIIRAGKGLNERESEVRIQFRDAKENIFAHGRRSLPANELVVRIQPEEALYLGVITKRPGLVPVLDRTNLDLRYHQAFKGHAIPEAYECLLLDVLEGDKSLFIRDDELAAAWDIFTPVLKSLDEQRVEPEPYPFGSMGPPVDHLLDRSQFA
jgi:glucose-6-phosphate 1-dehydrogenase